MTQLIATTSKSALEEIITKLQADCRSLTEGEISSVLARVAPEARRIFLNSEIDNFHAVMEEDEERLAYRTAREYVKLVQEGGTISIERIIAILQSGIDTRSILIEEMVARTYGIFVVSEETLSLFGDQLPLQAVLKECEGELFLTAQVLAQYGAPGVKLTDLSYEERVKVLATSREVVINLVTIHNETLCLLKDGVRSLNETKRLFEKRLMSTSTSKLA